MSSSNSIILTQILNAENSEWREAINAFMKSKTQELQAIMKSTVEKTISEKISHFYNRPFDNFDAILFDTNPGDIGKKCAASLQLQISHNPNLRTTYQPYLKTIDENGGKCFIIDPVREPNTQHRRFHVFKNFIIIQLVSNWSGTPDCFDFHPHTFSTDMLFALKHFQVKNDYGYITSILKIYNDHPEYFKQNCSEFESVCKREYEDIQNQKQHLQSLIDENAAKIEYYRSLEEQIRKVEDDKRANEEERLKLKEGKDLLSMAKQKLAGMRADIERERQQLEEDKTKFKADNFDMDDFLEN